MKRKKNIFLYLSLFFLLGFNYFLFGIIGIIYFFVLSSVYFILLFRKNKVYTKRFLLKESFKRSLKKFVLLYGIIFVFVYGIIYIFPMSVSTIYLKNPNTGKEVILQGMIHLGEDSFYKSIKTKIKELEEKNYIYYFEGVKPGTKENNENFSKMLGLKVSPKMYEQIKKAYGLEDQSKYQMEYVQINEGKSKNVDLNIDQIMELIHKHKIPVESNNFISSAKMEVVLNETEKLNSLQLKIFQELNKATISTFLRYPGSIDFIWQLIYPKNFNTIILEERNHHLVKEIVKSNDKKIYVTYGEAHLSGIVNLLQREGFFVEKTRKLNPLIKNPYFE